MKMSFNDQIALPASQVQRQVSQSVYDDDSSRKSIEQNKIDALDGQNIRLSSSELTFKITKLSHRALMICLMNAIDKLTIINSILQLNDEDEWYRPFMYDTIEERVNDIKKTQTLLPDSVRDPLQKLTGLQKLKRDTTMFIATLRFIVQEMQSEQSIQFLLSNVTAYEKYNADEEDLKYECSSNIKMVRQLISDIRLESKKGNEQLKVLNAHIQNLDNIVHDAGVTVDLTLRFTNHWDLNRYNQNKMRLKIEEERIQNDIDQGNALIDNENRIHFEIEKYLRLNQEMNLEMIEKRMQMYDTDTEQSDLDFKKLLADQAIQRKEYKNMKKEYKRRKNEMAEWITDKTTREEIENTIRMRDAAATRAQAWWRGLMVRRAMGPYKFLKALRRKAAAAAAKRLKQTQRKQSA